MEEARSEGRVGQADRRAQRGCRPDAPRGVAFLSSRAREPSEGDWSELTLLLKRLSDAPDLGSRLQPDKSGQARLRRRSDASLNAREGAKPRAGVYATLGGGGVAFKPHKAKAAPKPTAEAELNALLDAASLLARDRELAVESQLVDGEDEAVAYEEGSRS